MSVTIDKAGRLVIPKEIREKAGITPGMPLSIRVDNGAITLEPERVPMRLVKRGRFLVIEPDRDADVPPITTEDTNRMLEEIRLEREREVSGPFE
jgi:AbrB family looped-hinge helix DNA binding protein